MSRAAFAVLMLVTAVHAAVPTPVEFALWSDGSALELVAATKAELATSFSSYVSSCRAYEVVTGQPPSPQPELQELWSSQERLPHAVFRATFSGQSGQALAGVADRSGPTPVLFRDDTGRITSLIKCSGLDGLLLTCRVHSLMPGTSPSPDCAKWRELKK